MRTTLLDRLKTHLDIDLKDKTQDVLLNQIIDDTKKALYVKVKSNVRTLDYSVSYLESDVDNELDFVIVREAVSYYNRNRNGDDGVDSSSSGGIGMSYYDMFEQYNSLIYDFLKRRGITNAGSILFF